MPGIKFSSSEGVVLLHVGEDKYKITDLEAARKLGEQCYECCSDAEKSKPVESEKVNSNDST